MGHPSGSEGGLAAQMGGTKGDIRVDLEKNARAWAGQAENPPKPLWAFGWFVMDSVRRLVDAVLRIRDARAVPWPNSYLGNAQAWAGQAENLPKPSWAFGWINVCIVARMVECARSGGARRKRAPELMGTFLQLGLTFVLHVSDLSSPASQTRHGEVLAGFCPDVHARRSLLLCCLCKAIAVPYSASRTKQKRAFLSLYVCRRY